MGSIKELCNTEDKVCYFNIAVCMHGSLAGKVTHGKSSPWQKSTKLESLTNFSVLPSPTLRTSESSKVRVISVQRPSNRYRVRSAAEKLASMGRRACLLYVRAGHKRRQLPLVCNPPSHYKRR